MHFYQTQKKDTVETFSRHESAVRRCPKRRSHTNSLGIQHSYLCKTVAQLLRRYCPFPAVTDYSASSAAGVSVPRPSPEKIKPRG